MKAMVVDDDVLTLEIVRDRLEGRGIEVLARSQPLGTSAAIVAERPDFVLLDLSMPGLSGTWLASMCRANPELKNVIVILHSSRDAKELAELAESCGAAGALVKTHDDRTFFRQLEQILRRVGVALPGPA